MTTIYLTRHGQTEWNLEKRFQGWGDSPLTELGISQGKSLGKRLRTIRIDSIYTSPIKRAYKTAEIIKGNRDISLIPYDELKEMNFGQWEGMTTDEINTNDIYKRELVNLFDNPSEYVPFDGETYDELLDRTAKIIDKIIKENDGKSILIVTHGLTLKAILHYFNRDISLNDFINSQVMGQASLTQINVENNKFEIVLKNDTSHYEDLSETTGW